MNKEIKRKAKIFNLALMLANSSVGDRMLLEYAAKAYIDLKKAIFNVNS